MTDLYQKWKTLSSWGLNHFNHPDSKVKENIETWEESVKKFPEWHLNRLMQFVGDFAYIRMKNCKNYRNSNVECLQLEDGNDPYHCVSCGFSTLEDFRII